MAAHPMDFGDTSLSAPLLLIAGILIAYLVAVIRQRRAARNWRIASFISGIVLLAVAMSPPLVNFAHHDLRGHMIQHLLIGMLAPISLVLAAPVTLA